MAEETKTLTPEEVKTQAEALAEKEVAAIKKDVDARMAEIEKDYEAKKTELEKEFAERKAALVKEFNEDKKVAAGYVHEAEAEIEAHKKEILCGVMVAAAGSLVAGLLMHLLRSDRR